MSLHNIGPRLGLKRPGLVGKLIALVLVVVAGSDLLAQTYKPFRFYAFMAGASGRRFAHDTCRDVPGCANVRLQPYFVQLREATPARPAGWHAQVVMVVEPMPKLAFAGASPLRTVYAPVMPDATAVRRIVARHLSGSTSPLLRQEASFFDLRLQPVVAPVH